MGRSIYRIELTGRDLGGAETVYHYATEGFTTSPGRTNIPNTFVAGRLRQPLLFSRNLFGQGQARGTVQIGHGVVELENADGELDALARAAFDSQRVIIYRIDSDTPNTDTVYWQGVAESTTLDENTFSVTVREPTYRLDTPLQTTKYAGNNALPGGLEGTASDLKGKPKPIWVGYINHVKPPNVNTTRLVYQMHSRSLPTAMTLNVFDNRAPISAGVLRTGTEMLAGATRGTVSFAASSSTVTAVSPASHGYANGTPIHITSSGVMPAPFSTTTYYFARSLTAGTFSLHPTAADATGGTNAITATGAGTGTIESGANQTPPGRYDWSNDNTADAIGVFIRLGTKPTSLTVSGWDGSTTKIRHALRVIVDILNGRSTFAGTITLLPNLGFDPGTGAEYAFNQASGAFFEQEISALAAMQVFLGSVNASMCAAGVPHLHANGVPLLVHRIEKRFNRAPLLKVTDADVIEGSLRRPTSGDPERGIPAHRANVNYKRNYTVQSDSEIAGASAADIAFAKLEYRTVTVDNSYALAQYPSAPEINVDTVLDDLASATEFGEYLVGGLGLYKFVGNVLTCDIPLELVLGLSMEYYNFDSPGPTLKGIAALVPGYYDSRVALGTARFNTGDEGLNLLGWQVDTKESIVTLTLLAGPL